MTGEIPQYEKRPYMEANGIPIWSFLRITIYHKIIALITAILFIFNILVTDVARAFNRPPGSSEVVGPARPRGSKVVSKEISIEEFEIPAKLGEVKDKHKGRGGTIIYIQDAHCNYAAQKAISNIISHLNEEYGIDLISLEGGAGDYDLSLFTDIENEDTRGRVSDYFMKQGRVSGPEFFAINNPGKVALYGVEDADLYIKNLDIYRDSLKYVTGVNNTLNHIRLRIEELKKHIYTENLFRLDSDYGKFKEDKIDLKEFIEYLFELSLERKISLKKFPNVRAIYEAVSKEKGINFKRANSERFDLINELKEALPRHDLDRFTLKTFLFKTGQLSEAAYHNYLKEISDRYKVNLSRKPNLKDYITYINLYEKADKLEVFNEIEDLFELVIDKEFKDDTQETLFRMSKHAEILKNIFNIKATRREIDYYNSHRHEFGISTIIDFIERISLKYGESPHFDNSARLIDKRRDEMLKFYKYALSRDAAFVKNIKRAHKQFANDASIIVAGGFHNENLTTIFKENDFSYIVIRPVFKNGNGYKSPYYKLLSGGLSDMEEEIVAAVSALALASIFNGLAVKFYGQAAYGAVKDNLEIAEAICEHLMQNRAFHLKTKSNGTIEFTFEKGKLVAKNLEKEPATVNAELEKENEEKVALLRDRLERLPEEEGVRIIAAAPTLAEKAGERPAGEPTAQAAPKLGIKNLLRKILQFTLPAFPLLFVAADWGLLVGYGATLLTIIGGVWAVRKLLAWRRAVPSGKTPMEGPKMQTPTEELSLINMLPSVAVTGAVLDEKTMQCEELWWWFRDRLPREDFTDLEVTQRLKEYMKIAVETWTTFHPNEKLGPEDIEDFLETMLVSILEGKEREKQSRRLRKVFPKASENPHIKPHWLSYADLFQMHLIESEKGIREILSRAGRSARWEDIEGEVTERVRRFLIGMEISQDALPDILADLKNMVDDARPGKDMLPPSLWLANLVALILRPFGITLTRAEKEDYVVPWIEEGIILGIMSMTGWGVMPYMGIRLAFIVLHLIQDRITHKTRTAYQSMAFPSLISAVATLAFLIFGATPEAFAISSIVHGGLNYIVGKYFPEYTKGVLTLPTTAPFEYYNALDRNIGEVRRVRRDIQMQLHDFLSSPSVDAYLGLSDEARRILRQAVDDFGHFQITYPFYMTKTMGKGRGLSTQTQKVDYSLEMYITHLKAAVRELKEKVLDANAGPNTICLSIGSSPEWLYHALELIYPEYRGRVKYVAFSKRGQDPEALKRNTQHYFKYLDDLFKDTPITDNTRIIISDFCINGEGLRMFTELFRKWAAERGIKDSQLIINIMTQKKTSAPGLFDDFRKALHKVIELSFSDEYDGLFRVSLDQEACFNNRWIPEFPARMWSVKRPLEEGVPEGAALFFFLLADGMRPEILRLSAKPTRAPPTTETTPSKGVILPSLWLVNGFVYLINSLLGIFNRLFGTRLVLTASKFEREDIAVPLLSQQV